MGQQEILEILKKSNVPLTVKEIAERIRVKYNYSSFDINAIGKTIKKLEKYSEVQSISIPRQVALKFYGCKRSMKMYYV